MTASPTPEQSAAGLLGIFESKNCIAGDPLKISDVKAQFSKNMGMQLIMLLALCMRRIAVG